MYKIIMFRIGSEARIEKRFKTLKTARKYWKYIGDDLMYHDMDGAQLMDEQGETIASCSR